MTITSRLLTEEFASRLPGLTPEAKTAICKDCGREFPTVLRDPEPTCTRCLALDKDRGIECRD